MKLVILAGGLGTRISEESETKPKPMVEVGGRPLLWHIMKIYASHGIREFVICLGYKGYVIKEFFINYQRHLSNLEIDLKDGSNRVLESPAEDWKVTLIETGEATMTGGRLKRVAPYLGNETFCMTYGDGLANVDISAELAFHRKHGKLATVAAVQPPGRFGVLAVEDDHSVSSFQEKPSDEIGWINGGFFVLEPRAIDYIAGDATSFEQEPLKGLTADGQLAAFEHTGFWQPCDTLRDKRELEKLWAQGNAPWRVW
ncbi:MULTISPECIES: glucose-1-phosphate cytidylyltransferase [Mesorhizobium]|uniref:Glucose-1-phosphate cytidylyltransferase n=1 Tax=Mesorhizobium captivum TaxID=3072319 RepID=A0ABU4YX61_9HYPH|nr:MULTISPECIES: glucose-1-phosphate cytidylyltransferase [unclassified Mesorhizobium]MDX8446006.1 glucose-1-phosphate cytidylyltransferase [Mesorhizobium sp. VK3C]MDX8491567.1 glucose-1-phosphate cytidylyltransferase [Mesorhizobium sp. VK22B]MDX8505190.1 glucose-1-phosphate cytidylyltransferase [Mesorhizobium sp. VK22E]RWA87159.1 MAG: glucose-1-phosphate cytidylyltransferase [Mesorhizobium sp.]RWE04190.1 MAG: glucose-1-phosphate cytidylyltransferase [Mesorhizobium sp.]